MGGGLKCDTSKVYGLIETLKRLSTMKIIEAMSPSLMIHLVSCRGILVNHSEVEHMPTREISPQISLQPNNQMSQTKQYLGNFVTELPLTCVDIYGERESK